MNCPHGRRRAAVITKKCSDHEIFITKIFFHGIFSSFTKFLDHENLELYGMSLFSRRGSRWYIDTLPHPNLLSIVKSYMYLTQGGVTPIGAVSRAATAVKIFDRLKMALIASSDHSNFCP